MRRIDQTVTSEEDLLSEEWVEGDDSMEAVGLGWDGKEYLPQGTVGCCCP